MRWRVITPGKPSFSWVRDGVQEYEKRLSRYAEVDRTALKRGGLGDFQAASGSARILALDERGETWSTEVLARRVEGWESGGIREVAVWIGGADGLPPGAREAADEVISLGAQTLMHELALLVWMEQLYRIHTLLRGHPYHRG